MAAPNLTVVVPTHNRRAALGETLGAVLTERRVEIEVVVVDDASDDDTWEWLSSEAKTDDPRVRPLRLSPGRGGSGARNAGLAEVRSPYVMFLDDDDIVAPGALESLVRVLDRHPKATGAGGTHATFGPTDIPHRQPTTRIPLTVPIWREVLWGWNLQPGAGIFRTDVVRAFGGWDESLRRCEDLDFNFRFYGHRFALVPATVLYYRQHPAHIESARHDAQHALAAEVRRRFVATLTGRDREDGERILRARPRFDAALEAYEHGDFRAAAAGFSAMLRTAPCLTRSPVLTPWFAGLLAKSAIASAAPPRALASIRARRRMRRMRRLAKTSPS